jgi:hypothetical protein
MNQQRPYQLHRRQSGGHVLNHSHTTSVFDLWAVREAQAAGTRRIAFKSDLRCATHIFCTAIIRAITIHTGQACHPVTIACLLIADTRSRTTRNMELNEQNIGFPS